MRDKFTRFMMGRYGIDTLGKVNIGVVLVLLIVNMFFEFTMAVLAEPYTVSRRLLAYVFKKCTKALP